MWGEWWSALFFLTFLQSSVGHTAGTHTGSHLIWSALGGFLCFFNLVEVARVDWQVWLGVFAKRCGMFWAACELCGAAVAFARKRRFYMCVKGADWFCLSFACWSFGLASFTLGVFH